MSTLRESLVVIIRKWVTERVAELSVQSFEQTGELDIMKHMDQAIEEATAKVKALNEQMKRL